MGILRRLAAVSAAAGLVMGAGVVTATGARADTPGLSLRTSPNYYVPSPGDSGYSDHEFAVMVGTVGGPVAGTRELTVDLSAFTGKDLEVRDLSSACTTADLVLTCMLDADATSFVPAHLSVPGAAWEGFGADVPLTATAPGARSARTSVHVVIGVPDLSTAALPERRGLPPGAAVPFSPIIRNEGVTAPVGGFTVYIHTSDGDSAASVHVFAVDGPRPANCHYAQAPRSDFWCAFSQEIAPHTAYTIDRPLRYRTLPPLVDGYVSYTMWAAGTVPLYTPVDLDDFPYQGDDPALTLRPAQTQESLQQGWLHVTGHADYQALGGTVQGRRGQTVHLRVGVRNAGPGSLLPPRSDAALDVTLPAGVSVLRAANGASPAPACTLRKAPVSYRCPMRTPLGLHQAFPLDLTLRIDRETAGAAGSVRIVQPVQAPIYDPDADNDVAPIRIRYAGSGTDGGTGGDAGGTGHAGTAGAASGGAPTATGAPGSGAPSGTGSQASSTPTQPRGTMAATGSGGTRVLFGAAGTSLLAGAAAVVVARRRRTRSPH